MSRSDQRPISEIIDGVGTTSEKIRLLGREGYLRTEIAAALSIRYQHVRKVLLDAGIADGLSRPDRSSSMLSATPKVKPGRERRTGSPDDHLELLSSGLRLLGEWCAPTPDAIQLSTTAPSESGVYAFVLDDQLVYIGVTERGLVDRFRDYRIGHPRQGTSSRVKQLILEHLARGSTVGVLIATPEALVWNGLPISTSHGLELARIKKFQPTWNRRSAG